MFVCVLEGGWVVAMVTGVGVWSLEEEEGEGEGEVVAGGKLDEGTLS